MTARTAAEPARRGRWSAPPLVLVVVLLVASVLIPARETWRIMRLLRETAEVIEPARILVARLEFGLAVEEAALERYARSPDGEHRTRYTAAQDENRRLAAIEDLAAMLGSGAVDRATMARTSIGSWRASARPIVEGQLSQAELAVAMQLQHERYQAALAEISTLGSYLATEGDARREQIRSSEQLSLLVNAALVLVALAAVHAVTRLRRRERRLSMILQRRIEEEAALREAAETLAAAYSIDDVTEQIAHTALAATGASGAFVEYVAPGTIGGEPVVIVHASAGSDVPPAGSRAPYAGSYTELAVGGGEPVLIPDLSRAELRSAAPLRMAGARSVIVLPLGHGHAPAGALFVLSPSDTPFGTDDLARARTFGHLAALAHEKARLLDEARAGRGQLERVMKSRSRLMRGFSHDVKNPLGAADGYAELLTAGVYGTLSDAQRESLTRIRRSIRSALDLIDDLHEMARAETGNINVSLRAVDLAELVRASGDDYRAAAEATGLSLTVTVESTPLVVETDRIRVRQILSNLLSNAIKYTERGSVGLRAHRQPAVRGTAGDGWVLISVSDTGCGVPPDKWEAIFEEFVRLGASEKSGAGLGLAVSQRLAHALGGRITVESEVGSGSTFTLHLPLHAVSAAPPRDEPAPAPTRASGGVLAVGP